MAAKWQSKSAVYRKYIHSISELYETREDFRVFIEVLLSLVAIGVFGAFAIRPTLVTVASLFSDIKSKREVSAILDQKIKNINDAQAFVAQFSQPIALLSTAVSDTPAPMAVVRQIEGLAQRHNVLVTGITLGTVTLIGNPDETINSVGVTKSQETVVPFPTLAGAIPINASFRGDYRSLAALLNDLEAMLKPLFEDKVVLALEEVENNNRLTLTITGRVPYLLSAVDKTD